MRNLKQEMDAFRVNHKPLQKQVRGADFRYWLSGSGKRTYVLLPGGMGCGEFFYNHILSLEKENKVLTLEYPVELKDNNQLADGIIALIESLTLKHTIFIGQSYGGMIAQVIAKRHPDKVAGMVLSATGTATDNIISADKKLSRMIAGQRTGLKIVKFLPYSWIKKAMRKKMDKYIHCGVDEIYLQYIKDVFHAMLEIYDRDRYNLMTGLLLDFFTKQRFVKKDFESLKTNPLLIFSPDDHTFSEKVQAELVSLLPSPVVNRELSGGHLSIILKSDQFVKFITTYFWDRS